MKITDLVTTQKGAVETPEKIKALRKQFKENGDVKSLISLDKAVTVMEEISRMKKSKEQERLLAIESMYIKRDVGELLLSTERAKKGKPSGNLPTSSDFGLSRQEISRLIEIAKLESFAFQSALESTKIPSVNFLLTLSERVTKYRKVLDTYEGDTKPLLKEAVQKGWSANYLKAMVSGESEESAEDVTSEEDEIEEESVIDNVKYLVTSLADNLENAVVECTKAMKKEKSFPADGFNAAVRELGRADKAMSGLKTLFRESRSKRA